MSVKCQLNHKQIFEIIKSIEVAVYPSERNAGNIKTTVNDTITLTPANIANFVDNCPKDFDLSIEVLAHLPIPIFFR